MNDEARIKGRMMKILITDAVSAECAQIFEREGWSVQFTPELPPSEVRRAISDADVLIVRSQTQVTAELLSHAQQLKIIGRAGAGVDNIDVEAATRRGILVMNTPGGNTISTAEHTMALLLALARNIPLANLSLREGKWDRKSFTGTELYEKTIGIVGVGRVGKDVAKRSRAFGMRVVGCDHKLSSEEANELGIERVPFESILTQSDIISIHTPLTKETNHLFRSETFKKCKRGVWIINCARGGIVDDHDLLEALNAGIVGGAALDVFEEEPPKNSLLLFHSRVVATPHLGASTKEAQDKVALQIAHQVVDAIKGKNPIGAVNQEAWHQKAEI